MTHELRNPSRDIQIYTKLQKGYIQAPRGLEVKHDTLSSYEVERGHNSREEIQIHVPETQSRDQNESVVDRDGDSVSGLVSCERSDIVEHALEGGDENRNEEHVDPFVTE